MAGWPSTGGTVISKTPNSFFFISWESRFQPSGSLLVTGRWHVLGDRRTEIANEVGAQRIGGPFPVGDGVVVIHVNSEFLVTLKTNSSDVDAGQGERARRDTLENFSRPPSC